MAFGGRQTPKLFVHLEDGQLESCLDLHSLEHLCAEGGHGDDRGTCPGFEGGLGDAAVIDFEVEFESVTAALVSS